MEKKLEMYKEHALREFIYEFLHFIANLFLK